MIDCFHGGLLTGFIELLQVKVHHGFNRGTLSLDRMKVGVIL